MVSMRSIYCTNLNLCITFSFSDKFDQFWAVNRRLMETPSDQDGFKHIPMRCYNEVFPFCRLIIFIFMISFFQDGTYFQKLITPNTATGQKKTFQNLLEEFSNPAKRAG